MPRSHSDYNLEQPSDEMDLADNLTHAHPSDLPLPNRMHLWSAKKKFRR
jgi:hypothetical protein